MYYYGPMSGPHDWGVGVLAFFLWIVVFIVIVAVLVKVFSGNHKMHYTTQVDEPFEIAKKRYAKGEITKDEFEQLKKDLK